MPRRSLFRTCLAGYDLHAGWAWGIELPRIVSHKLALTVEGPLMTNDDREYDDPAENPTGRISWKAAFGSSLVGLMVLTCAYVLRMRVLPASDASGLATRTFVDGRNPNDFLVLYALGLLTALGVSVFAKRFAESIANFVGRNAHRLVVPMAVLWMLNLSLSDQGRAYGFAAGDDFHEGEYTAFRRAYLEDGLNACRLIHGPALQIMPALAAGDHSPEGFGIARARLVRSLFSVVALCGCIWTVRELAAFHFERHAGIAFRLALLVVVLGFGPLYDARSSNGTQFRDMLFWPQCALLVRWLRICRDSNSTRGSGLTLGILTGLATAAHPFVNYERTLNMIVLIPFVIVLVAAAYGVRRMMPFALCVAIGTSLPWGFIPSSVRQAALGDIAFWTKYGDRTFSLFPGFAFPVASEFMFHLQFGILCVVLIVLLHSFWESRDRSTAWIRQNSAVLLILAVACLSQRRVIARTDRDHVAMAGLSMAVLVAAMSLRLARSSSIEMRLGEMLRKTAPLVPVAIIGLFMTAPQFSPSSLIRFATDWRNDSATVAFESREIVAEIKRLAGDRPSSLFSLDSNGTWHYLLRSRSPSPIHQAWYAASPELQDEVVAAMESAETPVVIVNSGKKYDNIPAERVLHRIMEYVKMRYEPAAELHGHVIHLRKSAGRESDGRRPNPG